LPRGRTRQGGSPGSRGFILADALVALLIAAIGFAVILGGATGALRAVAAQRARLLALIQEENEGVQQAPGVVAAGP